MITIDEAMRRAADALDQAIANAMDHGIEMLTNKGATHNELKTFCEWYSQVLADDRAIHLANLRAMLERKGETLQ